MVKFLHILTAVTLIFPLGLLEALPCWKEFASSNCMLEEVAGEDSEVVSRSELEKQFLSIEHRHPLEIARPVLQISPLNEAASVDRGCVEMRGCRPPPAGQRCSIVCKHTVSARR
jgi:hypothetical protein